jgi:hypothetical protein
MADGDGPNSLREQELQHLIGAPAERRLVVSPLRCLEMRKVAQFLDVANHAGRLRRPASSQIRLGGLDSASTGLKITRQRRRQQSRRDIATPAFSPCLFSIFSLRTSDFQF